MFGPFGWKVDRVFRGAGLSPYFIFDFLVSFSDRFHGANRIYFEYEMNDLKMITSNKLIIVYMVNIRDKYWIREKYTMIMMD